MAYSYVDPNMSVQAKMNIGVMKSDSLFERLAEYPKVWPPLYPSTLWLIHNATGLQAGSINKIFCALILLMMALYTRSNIDKKFFVIPSVLLALNTAMYLNMRITSETMMVLQCLLLILLLAKHSREPRYSYIFLLGLLTGAICLTRYFGLIWVFPSTVLCLILGSESVTKKLRFVIVYGLTSFLVCVIWVAHVFISTGHVTGMDRTGTREDVTGGMAVLVSMTDFHQNVVGTLKTATYDLLSPYHNGDYQTVLFHEMTFYELFLAFVLLAVFVITLLHLAKLSRLQMVSEEFKPKYIPAIFTVTFLFLTILIWSLGNNDPIFTRFISPVYPFFFLAVYAVYIDIDTKSFPFRYVRYFLVFVTLIYVGNQIMEYANQPPTWSG
jgi:4-amino-4-deoxy-L-arabinose transferase-like glycosyltransferase